MSQRIPQKPKRRRPDFRQDPCQDVFTCRVCGWPVGPQDAGTRHRNHCPNCLSSVHLDDEPGDRAADCGRTMASTMVPVGRSLEHSNSAPAKYTFLSPLFRALKILLSPIKSATKALDGVL